MGMNLMKMMGQVNAMKSKLMNELKKLEELEITGESGGGIVKVTTNGVGRFKSIKISQIPSGADQDSLELLEDLISAAMKDAMQKAEKEGQEAKSKATGGLKIPGLDSLLGL